MTTLQRDSSRNKLLRAMDAEDLDPLLPHFERVNLELRFQLERPNEPIEFCYFPEDGMASIVAKLGEDREIEIGVVGREGMVGTAALLGACQTPNNTFMQVEGWGWRIPVDLVCSRFEARPKLRNLLLRYVQAMMYQTAMTALANGRAKLEERLARWLLMISDRVDGPDVRLTHEFLAIMLGVRRPGVTEAMHILEGRGLIRANRGHAIILNREGLEVQANGSYGAAESEYRRLIPTL